MSSPSDSMTFCMLRDLTSCEKDSTVLTHARTHVRAHYTLSSLSLKESSGSNFRIIAVDLQLSSVCSFTLQVMNGYCKDIL